MPAKLDAQERADTLKTLKGWENAKDRDALCKSFKFRDFSQAWSFMSCVANLAEEMDHHPEWFNVYNKVDVVLTTHSAGGVTELDTRMAQKMNEFSEL